MRSGRKWGKETSRIYAGITGRSFKDVYNIAETIYCERRYYDVISEAYRKHNEGDCENALQILSEIPNKYNPCKIEWRYLKALCSKSAYDNFCGKLNCSAGSQIICYDKKSSYAYAADHKQLYVINCLKAEVILSIAAHGNTRFRFFYIGEGYFGTFDEGITVKLWKCEQKNVILLNQETQLWEKMKHLEMILEVINRMAGNSFALKGWAVTLAAGIFALQGSNTDDFRYVIAFVPIFIFWGLDAFYLSKERAYRALYKYVCRLDKKDIDFSMDISIPACQDKKNNFWKCMVSTTRVYIILCL